MDDYDDATYGEAWAELYDTLYRPPGDDQVDFLVRRAGTGPILELAIGSGRIALPLVEAGVPVHGVEISDQMLDRLRARPGGRDIPIVAADMTDFSAEGRYPLVLLGFNTLFGPLDAERQQGIFSSVASVLEPGGGFVIECFVPDLGRFDRGQTVRVREITTDRMLVDHSIHLADQQVINSMVEVRWTDGRSALLPVAVRYLWPDQIDAMAEKAGLKLAERFAWYDESPFVEDSSRHVSVYRL